MAYTAVPTVITGYTWTATDHNTYIRDNFAAGVPEIFTTKGDIAVATAADVATRLAAGTDGHILTVDSSTTTGLKYAAIGATAVARFKLNANQALANTTVSIVNFGTQVYNPDSAVTTGAAWKYTVPAAKGGYFLAQAQVKLASNTGWAEGEYLYIALYKNNSLFAVIGEKTAQAAASGGFPMTVNGATIVNLAATDYIDVRAYQNSGGAINITDGDYSHVSIIRLAQ